MTFLGYFTQEEAAATGKLLRAVPGGHSYRNHRAALLELHPSGQRGPHSLLPSPLSYGSKETNSQECDTLLTENQKSHFQNKR